MEHILALVKRLSGFGKVRYRRLAKSATRSFTALGLANSVSLNILDTFWAGRCAARPTLPVGWDALLGLWPGSHSHCIAMRS